MNNFSSKKNNLCSDNQGECIHHLFEAVVRRSPDAVAVVYAQESLTYQELNNRANQLANYLQTLGVGTEVLVGICVERSLEMLVGILGVLKAGGAYIPLDPAYPQERLAFMLEDSQVGVLLTQSHLVSSLPTHQAQVICLDTDWETISKHSECNLVTNATADNLAYVIYTSGSTGKPKGVLLQHGGLCNLAIAQKPVFNVQQDSSVLQFASFSFDGSVFEIFLTLAAGAKLVMAKREALLLGESLVQLLRDYAITTVVLPPAALAVMPVAELPALQTLVVAGESCPSHLVNRWAIGRRFINGYGPTEVTVCATAAICTAGTESLPIGYPIANVEVYLLDSQMQPVANGEIGEIYVGGAGVARGYLNRPELTAERFIPNPFLKTEGSSQQSQSKIYRTGDLGRYLPDGSLEFMGRSDTQVKLRGYRVEVGEIESILGQHPTVQQAAIAMREDGSGNKRLVAYVVPNQDWDGEHISEGQALSDEIYSQLSPQADPTFHIAGWNSSYTGLPIPAAEMREWVNQTVDRILALQPQRVLEIGCGSGLLLFRIAPYCTEYYGTDFSGQVVRYLQQQLQQLAQPLPQVSVSQRTADNFEGIEAETFDAVIINSVSQHFPNIDYMLRVIEGAVKVVKPKGSIFIGDVRSLPLLEAYHTSIQLYQAPDSLSKEQLLARVRSRIAQEEELVIAPAFFTALQQHLPQISKVQIQLKRGTQHNELTRFRYDVTLYIEDAVKQTKPSQVTSWLDWQAENLTIPSLRQQLQQQPGVLGLQRVPNRRLHTESKTLEWLKGESAPATVGEWRSHLQQQPSIGIDPEDFWALSQEFPYNVTISWSNFDTHNCYDVVFQHQALTETNYELNSLVEKSGIANSELLKTFANQPLQGKMSGKLALQLRRYLKEKLPDYMVPAAFVMLSAMPLTPNGKVDRKALPIPDHIRSELTEDYVPPRTPMEEALAEIWAEVLGLEKVGISDNFLELGGHSLTAVQIVSRIRDVYQVELPLRSLFTTPTIAELAQQLGTALPQSGSEPPAIVPVPRDRHLPLSFLQEGLWFLMQLHPDNPFYNESATIRISERVDVAALEKALNEIVRRHEAWRTSFSIVDGQPVQVIHQQLTLPLPVINLQHLPQEEREPEAIRLAIAQSNTLFDLSQVPLLRVMLVQLGEADYRLFVVLHHIIFDGISLRNIFLPELVTLYKAFASGQRSPLPELTIQYADFAVWQRKWLETVGANNRSLLQEKLAYWKQHLANLPTLQLPIDRPRPLVESFRGGRESLEISKELTEALKALSKREGVSLYMTLLAAFNILLSRYSGQEDIVLGTVTAGHNQPELQGVVGYFLNTLVLRTDLSGNPSFREVLHRVREVTLNAYEHQDLPFEKLVAQLQPERHPSQHPLFQVVFNQVLPLAEVDPHWQLNHLDVYNDTSEFDLSLEIDEQEDRIYDHIEYNSDLFDASTIRRLIGHFQTLLAAVVANPEQKIANLPLLTLAEQEQLQAWNQTQVNYAQDVCLHQLFENQVQQTPDAVAVVFGNQRLTYRELNQKANQLAHYLQKQGVAPEVLVGVCIERSLELIVAIIGILKAGGAYLPLDPAYPHNRLAFMLEDAQVSLLLTQQQLLALLPPQPAPVICLDTEWEKIATENTDNPQNNVTPENLVYVIYTSGSTGKSKGVMVEQRNLVNAYLNWEKVYQLKSVTSHLQMASFSFDVFSGDLVRALCSGGRLVLCPRDLLLTPHLLYEFMVQQQVDCAEFVPAVLRNLIEYLEASGDRLDFMRLLVCGSDSWYVKEYAKFRQFCNPQTRLINSFGLTEATIDSSYFESNTEHLSIEQIVPIGRPFPNTQLYILDQHRQPVPIGVAGELYIGGVGVARGYLNRLELTAEKFVLNCLHKAKENTAQNRLYKTGDLARYLADGNIQFLGRIDNQVKIRGFRIELGEIETALNQHPAVREVVVLLQEYTLGDRRLVAYVVANQYSEAVLDSSKLRRFLKDKLPDYMIPASFVMLDALPLTPNGKIDRKALPAPEQTRPELEVDWVAPRTPVEATLVKIWSEVLGVVQVGIEDNFFELGGHSLTAVQIVVRIRDIYQLDLPVKALFTNPTIAELAQQIEIDLPQPRADIQAIAPVPRDQHLPLSFMQEGLWLLTQLHPDNPFYNSSMSIRISEQVDVEALAKALNEIVRRHEAWRTSFAIVDGQPVQVIHPQLTLPLPVIDLQHLPQPEREPEAIRLATAAENIVFDLSQVPLLRTMLVRLGAADYQLILVLHHIIFDGISLDNIFLQELATLYKAYVNGQPSPLPELTIQYADFAVWQRQYLQTVGANGRSPLQEKLAYWKQQLANLSTLQLPTDRPRPPVQTHRGAAQTFVLDKELTGSLKALAKQEGATLFMTLLSAFQILLSRYSGQEDIIVGSPIAVRNHSQIERLIGFFVNTLVLRTKLEGNPSCRELLSRVRQVCLEAYAHQDLPFKQLVEELQPERDLSYTPIFQVMFILQNNVTEELDLLDLSFRSLAQPIQSARFDLTLSMQEQDGELTGVWVYNTDLFDASTIGRMIEHFQTLLSGIVAAPDNKIRELPLLSPAEERQVLVEWNQTQVDYPQHICIHQLIEQQVERTPDAVAVEFEGEQLTYRELNHRANQLGNYLQQLGVKPDTLVAICVERSLEMLIGLLGILKAGGAYVPIDPSYPPERLKFMLADSQAPILLTQERLLATLPETQARLVCLDRDWKEITHHSLEKPLSQVNSENLAYVIYTSGSTGKPKGTLITHQGLVNYLLWCIQAYTVAQGNGACVHSSIAFDATITGLFAPLLVGSRVHLLAENLGVEALSIALRNNSNYSLIKITPAQLEVLAQQLPPELAKDRTKAFVIGGENLTAQHIAFWQKYAPETVLINEYGPTETVVGCCIYQVSNEQHDSGSILIGKPIANTQLYILNQDLQPQPIGVPGELYIGGAGVARGYLNRPDLTAERFIPNPFISYQSSVISHQSAKIYKTGDLARYLPDGNIQFLGRVDNQVKIRGFRIELGEIEAALLQHQQVQEGVVVLHEDSSGERRLVAYIVANLSEPVLDGTQLRQFLKDKLPKYMIPSQFVMLSALPLTPNGKVDCKALPTPEASRSDAEADYMAPRTPVEATLVQIWSEVLGVPQVGIGDNFFELGGHSLSAVQIVVRIRTVYKVDLPVRELFTNPTIAELAQQLEADRPQANSNIPAIAPVTRDRHLPLSYVQEGLWLLMQLHPDNPFYNTPMTIRMSEQVNVAALSKALNEIVRRHEAWRTTFSQVDGQPIQVIHPQLMLPLPVIDLQGLPPQAREPEAMRLATAETSIPFDLSKAPLLRVTLFQLGEADYLLLLVLHHIIFDGISLHSIFLKELNTLYQAYASGQPSPLPELTIQYADFAVWQRQWLEDVGVNGRSPLQEKLAYWKQHLANLPTLQLPTDRPRPSVETFRGGNESLEFSRELTESLKALSRREGVTLYMLLLAAFKTVLSRYSGQEDIVLGTVTAGHNQPELQGVMGFFLNTLVLRTDLSGNPSFREVLHRVREVTLNAYAHQEVPFEKLVAVLRPDRRQSQHPLFQVAFNQIPPITQVASHWHLNRLDVQNDTSKFDLFLVVHEQEGCICEYIEYNTDLFDASTIRRLSGHLQTLLTAVVANPEQKIADLPILTVAEQAQLQAWNDTRLSYAQDVCLHQLFEAQAQKTPEAIALDARFTNSAYVPGIELTYRELDQKANQLARYLQALGVKPEVMVGIAVERSVEMAIAVLAILKAGGAYVPLDPAYPHERLAFMLADTQVPVLLTQQSLVATLPCCSAQIVCLDSDWDKIAQCSSEKINSGVSADNLAYVIYTSGSTGKPKGICLEQRPLLNLLAWHQHTLLTGVRTLQFASLSFDASFHEMFATWCSGGTLFLVSEALRRDPKALAQFLTNEKIEKVILPVVVLQQLADIAASQSGLLTSLREVITTGEQLQINKSIISLFTSLPNCRFHNHYGPSETHVVTALTLEPNPDNWPTYPSIGSPIANTQIYLLDSGLKPVPCGVPGELYISGDSLARGYLNRPDLTAQRFILNPLKNQQGTGRDKVDKGDSRQSTVNSQQSPRMYKTGDLARYLPDGKIEYLGRIDQQVKIRGFRIELGEIEAALLQHQEVREGVVVLREDTPGDKRLVAYVVSNLIPDRVPYESKCLIAIDGDRTVQVRTENISKGGLCLIGIPTAWERGKRFRLRLLLPVTSEELWLDGIVAWSKEQRTGVKLVLSPTEQQLIYRTIEYLLEKQGVLKLLQRTLSGNLRRFLKDKLPDYMIPASFVMLNALPLTNNGKVDRKALPAAEQTRSALETDFVAPRTPIEETLVQIWSEVLGLKQVGIHDNFFELGGHSLLGTQVISRLRDRYKLDLPLRCLFAAPTIAKLAEVVDTVRSQAPQLSLPLQRVPRQENLPLSFAQQRLWFLDQLLPGNSFYNFSEIFHLDGQLNIAILEQSLNEIIRRHEVLRTTFAIAQGQPVQIIAPELRVTIPVVNLQTLPKSEQALEVEKLTLAESTRSFELNRGPLLRATLLHLEAEKYVLLLTIHHIVFDGWSVGIFLRELIAIYTAFASGNVSPLPELPIQYADFTVWQRQLLQGHSPLLANQLDYWKQQLAELPILQLPTDYPRPPLQNHRGTRQSWTLSKDLTQQLHQLSQQEGVTLFMTLLAAFQTLLCRYTGSEDIPVGSVIANRNRSEIEGLIGFFVNTLVLRTDFSGSPSFRELLKRVQEVTLGAYAHQDLPFERLVEELEPERDLSRHPLFQVCFALQNLPEYNLELPSLVLNNEVISNGGSKFDLFLELSEAPDGIIGVFEYNTDLFDAATIVRMGEHLETLLTGIVADPDQKVSELPILKVSERQQLLVDWNNTGVDYPLHLCVHQMFEAQVDRTPDAVAVEYEGEQLTYKELNEAANQLANYLKNLGVAADVLVGICVERSLLMPIGLLAILKAGGAYIPLDPAYPQNRLAMMLEDAEVSVLLTQQHLLNQLPEHQAQVFCLDSDWHKVATQPSSNLVPSSNADNLIYVIYTSGSTGKPKGVQITHRCVVNFLSFTAEHLELTAADILLSVTTLSFDIAVLEMFLPITLGARVVIASRDTIIDGIELIAKLNTCGATIMQATPSTWRLMLEAGWQGNSHLKTICGGEALSRQLANQILQRCACLWNIYGPTETTIWSSTYKMVGVGNGIVPIGRPLANTQYYILDRYLQPVPIGVPGELYIGGTAVGRGYLKRPDLTAERFIPNPFIREQGTENKNSLIYKTGDLVRYLPDGNVEYISRIDHQVKIRGFRIELGEIESAIMQHPAVQTSLVIDREDIPGQKRLVAYVVQNTQHDSNQEQWQTEHVSQWQTIYEQTYKQATVEASLEESTFNTIGWNSSYTGMPIPQAEMREWVDYTVGRILSLQPKRVLEIGCGTGLLLAKIISHCNEYWATDFAAEALRQIQKMQALQPDWPQLTLLQRMADNFDAIAPDAFDTVIINSVVQYFPSINYLLRVLEGAVKAVQPGGFIFIGDVRSLPLQEAYHTSVALYQAPASLSIEELQERIKQRIRHEEELVIHPAFFTALKQHLPKLSHVQIQFKRGQYHNELTRFRYDVTLHVGNKTYPTVDISWLDWQKQKLTLPFIQQLLVMTEPEVLAIRNVPDARVMKEIKTIELLNRPDAVKTVAEIHSVLEQLPTVGVDPEELWTLTQDLPYWLDIVWTDSSINGCFEIVLRRHSTTETEVSKQVLACFKETSRFQPWNNYANQPLQGKFARNIVSELRRFIQDKLPEYMLPGAFVCLEKLPLTPNGKVDRKALPVPDQLRPTLEVGLLKPRTPIEAEMVGIWAKVLGIDNLGIKDNFFELGGNSLLAAQLMMYVRENFQIQLPVKHIFEQPTVEGLSQAIAQLTQASAATTTEIDFLAEAALDPEIYPQQEFDAENIGNPQHIFLTGSTGYLGAFLLHDFLQQTEAKVYCLVRAKNESEGLARIKNNLEKYWLWNSHFSDRIIPISGDLDQPLLGISPDKFHSLADQIDVIYHSGAAVNFVKPYSSLKAANVCGTQEVLRLACRGKLKPVHYISTIAVLGAKQSSEDLNVLREDDNIDDSLPYLNQQLGYVQSKWVSEKLVWIAKSRGVPVTVIRTGFAMGDSRTGVTNINDYLSRMIKGCIMLGCFPDLGDSKEELITVDYISSAVVHLSRKKASLGKAFHMVPAPEKNITMNQLFELVSSYGYQLQKVPFQQWLDQLVADSKHSQDNPLISLLPMFSEEGESTEDLEQPPVLDYQNTMEAIANSSISCHPMNAELFNRYISFFTRSGFIDFPYCKLSATLAGY